MRIVRLCKEFRVLPYEGGVLQQPALELSYLEETMNALDKFESKKSAWEKIKSKARGKSD